MFRYWVVLPAIVLVACDSPQLVSFNTPELCEPRVEGLATFSEATARCVEGCVLCVESEVDGRAWTYSVSNDDNCVCSAPARVTLADAGAVGPASLADGDAGLGDVDAGVAATSAPSQSEAGVAAPASDGCHSRLHLTRSQARAQCDDWNDCHVCVERVDYDGDPRSYLAHQCGCPDAYRVDVN